jgi:hypothetical protein
MYGMVNRAVRGYGVQAPRRIRCGRRLKIKAGVEVEIFFGNEPIPG